ncbi:uncharacterized protein HaLaN_29908, partial [Haematococcus lacustris]
MATPTKAPHGTASVSAVPPPPGVRANPGPFGLLCFGMTTCMLMFTTTKWSPGVSAAAGVRARRR